MAERPVVQPPLPQPPLDRYVVLEYIAEGGMGAIYLGKKLGAGGFEKEVVLKQLLPEFTQQPEFIDLFLREARLSANLDHANIVHTIDLVNAGDEYFIVMEYVRGGDLRTLMKRAKRRRKRIPPAAGIFIAREILSALAYAHQKTAGDGRPLGLIHRDVSPSNILVSGTGEVKLTDFGIAKASTHRSIFYRVKGKVGYMSPEQARSESLDPRSDLYSAAVCLYELLTGERLFVAAGLTTSADELYSQPVPAVSRKRQDLPKDLDKLMQKALSVDPAGRYQTAGELQEALLRVAHRNGLMCTASDLSRMLQDVCGAIDEWGTASVKEPPREGTEAYFMDRPTTDKLSLADLAEDAVEKSQHTAALPPGEADDSAIEEISDLDAYLVEVEEGASSSDEWPRGQRAPSVSKQQIIRRRPSTANAARLTGLELTSIIRAGELTQVGAKPLVDLSDMGEGRPPSQPEPPRRSRAPRADPILAARPATASAVVGTERVPPVDEPRRLPLYLVLAFMIALGAGAGVAIALSGPDLTPAPMPGPAHPERSAAGGHTESKNAPTGKLEVTSDPPGARVLVARGERCKTPCTVAELSTVSPTVIRLELDGHLPWTALVDPARDASARAAKLRRVPPAGGWGAVLIRSNAPATVLVGGAEVGHVTTEGPLPLPPGETELTLVAASGARKQLKVTVKAGETVALDAAIP